MDASNNRFRDYLSLFYRVVYIVVKKLVVEPWA